VSGDRASTGQASGNAVLDRILDRAGELFHQFGFKRVTMDDISHSLGMSKKTLYLHVPGKDALVEAFMRRFMERSFSGVQSQIEETGDVVELTSRLVPFLRSRLSRISPVMMADMQRHYPHLWDEINARRMAVLGTLAGMFEQGQQDGTIRPEINPKVMVKVMQTVIQEVANPATILELQVPVAEVIETFVTLMLRGALTERTRARFEETQS